MALRTFKLKQNGINGKLLSLLQNYLSNRQQRVVINGSESEWGPIKSGVPQGSVLGPLLFLIYVNDLEDNIKSSIKFFADETSLFSVVHDPQKSATDLNHDLDQIKRWAHQWRMSFNPDPTKPAQEVLYSKKKNITLHPPLYYNGIEVKRVSEHKHLGLILDSKLTFAKHITEKITIARKWIGIIKHLAPYLPLKSLDQIYKMHIRPHLDYCDIIFHSPVITHDNDTSLTLNYTMSALERTQYQAALAVSGAWKGSNRDKIYEELGWETLDNRRYLRRLIMIYKIIKKLTPEYLRDPIPSRGQYNFRSPDLLPLIPCRSTRYRNSFYPDSIKLWNNIGPEFRNAESLSIFKRSILRIIRPTKKDTFNIHNREGVKWIFQLRVGLSPLRKHKANHNFIDTPNGICLCAQDEETTQHFLLDCPILALPRRELFRKIDPILVMNDLASLSDRNKKDLLLYGNENLTLIENQKVLKATIKFIGQSGRFS